MDGVQWGALLGRAGVSWPSWRSFCDERLLDPSSVQGATV